MNLSIRQLILGLHAPDLTPKFVALHQKLHELFTTNPADTKAVDAVLESCEEPECIVCGAIICPYHEPLHFHHDGCPACSTGAV